MTYNIATSKPNYVVIGMSDKEIDLVEKAKIAARNVNRRRAMKKPSEKDPLWMHVKWEMENTPPAFDIDEELQRKYLQEINKTLKSRCLECNA